MRDIIEDLKEGKFEYNRGSLDFEQSSLELTVAHGGIMEGSFAISAVGDAAAEGIVKSDDYRMKVITPSFSGSKDHIAYRFHAETMQAGQVIKGNFVIISNLGEYRIPFTVTVEALNLDSSIGEIHNLFHFTNLAKNNWKEAVSLFYHPSFINLFQGNEAEYLTVYKGLSGNEGNEHNVEEFLLETGRKNPMEILLSKQEIELEDPKGTVQYELEITRNGWGYTKLDISCEGDFLTIHTNAVDDTNFLGNVYRLTYYIDADKLHDGLNLGKITICYNQTETVIPVQVRIHSDHRQFRNMERSRKRANIALMDCYKLFRARKISTKTWLEESTKVVDGMIKRDYYDVTAKLYQAQIMITEQRYNEAKWFLEKLKGNVEDLQDSSPQLWCYYLYLTTLYSRDEAYVDQITMQIQDCFEANPSNWRIAWLLSYMSVEYTQSMTKKWVMLEEQFEAGCNSPVLYIECSNLLLANPSLLVKLDLYEIQVLRYIMKNDLMEQELLQQVLYLVEKEQAYRKDVLQILEVCYTDYPTEDLLTAIITMLIRGQRTDAKAFAWYEKGIQQELRITRLYEYYMMSIDLGREDKLPRIVLLYFSYHSDLEEERNAYLYANVMKYREQDPEIYEKYVMQIREFVVKQLTAEQISTDLVYLYRTVLTDELLTGELAVHMANIIFSRRVYVDNPSILRAVVVYAETDLQLVSPVDNGISYIQVFTEGGRIFLEDIEGNLYACPEDKIDYLIPPGKLLHMTEQRVHGHYGLDTYYVMSHLDNVILNEDNAERYFNMATMEYSSAFLKRKILGKLVSYYYEKDDMETVSELLETLDPMVIPEDDRCQFIRFMLKLAYYMKAYELVRIWGPECLDEETALELATGVLVELPEEERGGEDLLWQIILDYALNKGRSNSAILQYASESYEGSIRQLVKLYREALALRMNVHVLTDRILKQILYTGSYLSEEMDILKAYAEDIDDPSLLIAFFNHLSYEFFVKSAVPSADLFALMTEAIQSGLELHLICKLAYVTFYAENKELISENVAHILQRFLQELIEKGIVLACYKEYSGLLPEMAWFQDQTVIEYRMKPGSKAFIHYVMETGENDADAYCTEQMHEIFEGVCTKVFVLFFGEKIQYYITEENAVGQQLTESATLARTDIGQETKENRFTMLNSIMVSKTLEEYSSVDQLMEEYYRKDYMVGKLFKMM